MAFTLNVFLELGLTILLACTLVYCIVLERRLATVRRGQESLKVHINALNTAISGADASLQTLKMAAAQYVDMLDERLKRARLHIDELSVLTVSGENIASRMEKATATPKAPRILPNIPPATLNRLRQEIAP